MLSLIQEGVVGDLEIDISRDEVISRLGMPLSWLGKPPCFGPEVDDPFATDVWFYYHRAVGIQFDSNGFSDRVWVNPPEIPMGDPLFADWPALNYSLTLGFLRDFLRDQGIRFFENTNPDGFIVTETKAFAYGFPYRDGLLVPFETRQIQVLEHVRSYDLFPDFVPPIFTT